MTSQYGPDYQLTYIEGTVQRLAIRGLWVTPAEVLEGLWKLGAAGVQDGDAETALYTFLERLSPYGSDWNAEPRVFPGWTKVREELAGQSIEDLHLRFGSDALRVASVAAA